MRRTIRLLNAEDVESFSTSVFMERATAFNSWLRFATSYSKRRVEAPEFRFHVFLPALPMVTNVRIRALFIRAR